MSGSRKNSDRDFAQILYENTQADYAEIPEITEEEFARATVRYAGRPARGWPPIGSGPKQQVTLRLDPQIQTRFRSSGPGWQGRMNTFLMHNEVVPRTIVEFDESIEDMEALIEQLREGGIRDMLESVETNVAKVERNIRNTKETVRSLRELLAWQPVDLVG